MLKGASGRYSIKNPFFQRIVWTGLVLTILIGIIMFLTSYRHSDQLNNQINQLNSDILERTVLINEMNYNASAIFLHLMKYENEKDVSTQKGHLRAIDSLADINYFLIQRISLEKSNEDISEQLRGARNIYLEKRRRFITLSEMVPKSDSLHFALNEVEGAYVSFLSLQKRLALNSLMEEQSNIEKAEASLRSLKKESTLVNIILFILLVAFSSILIVINKKLNDDNLEIRRALKENAEYKFALDQSALVEITDPEGLITHVNQNFLNLSKYSLEELIGHDHKIMNSNWHSKEFIKNLWDTVNRGDMWKGEIRDKAKDGSYFWMNTTIVPFINGSGRPYQHLIIRSDITEQKRAEELLVKSEAGLSSIINNTDAYIYSLDTDFRYIKFNNAFADRMSNIYGLEIRQGSSVFDFLKTIDPLEAIEWERVYTRVISGERLQFVKNYSKEGEPSYMSFSINPIPGDKGISGISCFARDITKHILDRAKLIKSASEIRNFAKHLNQMQEDERAAIAREIHDELGQQLAAMKIGISAFRNKGIPEERINGILKDIDFTIQSLRKIATQLRPGILDTLGLEASIEWLAGEFSKRTNIKCCFDSSENAEQMDKKMSICFFRICQEALTNISKHANASEVRIEMKRDNNDLIFKISDNGMGIENEKLENPFSMGLLGMRERANLIGGNLSISSKKDSGTIVQLTVGVQDN